MTSEITYGAKNNSRKIDATAEPSIEHQRETERERDLERQ